MCVSVRVSVIVQLSLNIVKCPYSCLSCWLTSSNWTIFWRVFLCFSSTVHRSSCEHSVGYNRFSAQPIIFFDGRRNFAERICWSLLFISYASDSPTSSRKIILNKDDMTCLSRSRCLYPLWIQFSFEFSLLNSVNNRFSTPARISQDVSILASKWGSEYLLSLPMEWNDYHYCPLEQNLKVLSLD